MAHAMNVGRRGFVAGSGVAVAGAAAGALGLKRAQADEAQQPYDYDVDIVVVGSGMGGMCAGVRALENGVENVMVVEISKWVGGGTSWAYGALHAGGSGKTVEEFNAATHYEADNVLSHTVKEGFEPLLHWLEDMGMPVNVSYDIATPLRRYGRRAGQRGRCRTP